MLYKLWKLARPAPGLLVILSAVSGLAPPWVIRYVPDNFVLTGREQLLRAAPEFSLPTDVPWRSWPIKL